mgnify:CR=1 FL=1
MSDFYDGAKPSAEGGPSPDDFERRFPLDPRAEQAVISAMMWDMPTVFEKYGGRLKSELWHVELNREIAMAIVDMHVSAIDVDVVSVTHWLREHNQLERIGGPARVSELLLTLSNSPTLHQLDYHLKILEGMSARRLMLKQSEALAIAALDYSQSSDQALAQAEAALFDVHAKGTHDGMEHVSKIIPAVIDEIDETIKRKGHVTSGVATGFTSLDRMFMGLKPGVHYVAARPSKGKTAYMMQIALNVGLGMGDYPEFDQAPTGVAIYSLETNKVSLVKRGLLNLAALNMQRIKDGQFSRAQQDDLKSKAMKMNGSKIYVEASFGLSIQNFRVKVRMLLKKHPEIKLIMIDYLQLMTSSSKKAEGSREREVAEISCGLSMAGHELKIPIICLAQLNREGDVSRPKASSLRESGQIEQDAQTITMLCDAPEWVSKDDPEDAPWAYLGADVVKQKDGPTTNGIDPVVMRFDKEFYRLTSTDEKLFSNQSQQHQPSAGPREKSNYDRQKGPRGRPRKDAQAPQAPHKRLTADEFFGSAEEELP